MMIQNFRGESTVPHLDGLAPSVACVLVPLLLTHQDA
ncbi:hypothetical protein ABIC85_001347 [Oerskovia enterophila]